MTIKIQIEGSDDLVALRGETKTVNDAIAFLGSFERGFSKFIKEELEIDEYIEELEAGDLPF